MCEDYTTERGEEEVNCELGQIESEFLECRHDLRCILRTAGDPDVHIGGGAGIAMIGHRVTADEQILNLTSVGQLQEFFEERATPTLLRAVQSPV